MIDFCIYSLPPLELKMCLEILTKYMHTDRCTDTNDTPYAPP